MAIIKKHIRVIDDFEDDAIEMYLKWAENKIKSSVTNYPDMYSNFFNNSVEYERAVILLTSHYFNNRLPTHDKIQYNLAFGLRDAMSHLKADFYAYKREMEAIDDE